MRGLGEAGGEAAAEFDHAGHLEVDPVGHPGEARSLDHRAIRQPPADLLLGLPNGGGGAKAKGGEA